MRRLSWDEEAQGSFRDRGKMHGFRSHTHVTFFTICPLFLLPMLQARFYVSKDVEVLKSRTDKCIVI